MRETTNTGIKCSVVWWSQCFIKYWILLSSKRSIMIASAVRIRWKLCHSTQVQQSCTLKAVKKSCSSWSSGCKWLSWLRKEADLLISGSHLQSVILTVKSCSDLSYWLLQLHMSLAYYCTLCFIRKAKSCSYSSDRYENYISIPFLHAFKLCPLFFYCSSQCFTNKVILRLEVNDLTVSKSFPWWSAWLACLFTRDSLDP